MSVHRNIGGGRHGNFGLLLTHELYAWLSPIPYIYPPYPPAPVYPPFLTHQQISFITDQHKEAMRTFNEVIGVERALTQQVIEAIDESYLKAVKNRITGQFTGTILDIT